jgi:hypothetical protein
MEPVDIPEETIEPATLEKLTEAANKQVELEKRLTELAETQKQVQLDLERISGGFGIEGVIPGILAEVGLLSITLKNGMIVKTRDELKAPSMAKDSPMREKVLDWADRTGNGGVIKDMLMIPFEKGDANVEKVVKLLEELKAENPNFLWERFRSIHPQTLVKLFRDILEKPKEGETLPMEELEIKQYVSSKIDYAKVKK